MGPGDIDDSAPAQSLDRLVEVVDARARGERLVLPRNLVEIEGAEEAPVVLERRVEGAREAVRVDAVAVRLVVLLVARC